ncbi:MAG: CDP-glycerol glycerophosphotransferase family protein [Clostridium sp.]|nr:CDP-glycerol glycerophosphotransferase family protein [Clostridium sp.]
MKNDVSIVNLGEKNLYKDTSARNCIYHIKDFKNVNDLINSINSKYVIFTRKISDINIEKIHNLKLSDKEMINDIIIFLDSIDYLPNKIDVNILKENFLECILISYDNILVKREKIKKIDILNEDFIELNKFDEKLSIYLKEEYIYNKNLNINFSIDDIFKLEKLSSKQKYIYLYNIFKIILREINGLEENTATNIFKKLQEESRKINSDDYILFLKNSLNEEEFNRISTIFYIIKNGFYSQLLFLSKEYSENKEITEEYKKLKIEYEKIFPLIKNNRIKINIYYDKIISILRHILVFLEYVSTKPFLFGKDIWLIGERSDQAEDNAFRFFKYVRENYPKKKIYYIIDKKSTQYKNVKDLGNVIDKDSFKHRIYLMHAKKLISAYDFFKFLLPKDSNRFKKYNIKYMNSTRIFLQHGVAMNKANYYNKHINKYDYILASTKKEYNMFTKEYGYNDDKIIKIGLPRYDQLIDKSYKNEKKIILFMPTWRSSLAKLSKDEFIKTQYYKDIDNLINDKELNNFIESKNLKLIVYLHYEMQKFNSCFKFLGNNVVFMNRENAVVQNLLKESNLLITDYSSVGVDFSYLNKPVIFYQFSSYNFHYNINKEEKYTLYSDFGKVVTKKEEVISTLKEWENNNYNTFYHIEDDLFFNRNSIENCKKIYEFINKIPTKNIRKYIVEVPNKNIKEKRIYDKNYELISREFYNEDLRRRKIIYKNGFIVSQILYDKKGRAIKRINCYKDIKIKISYLDVYDKKGNLIIKQNVNKNGVLSSKVIYYKDSNTIKTITKYNVTTEKIKSIEHFHKNGNIKSELTYTEDGLANKYYFYSENGNKLREYDYFKSGKVKVKRFYNEENGKLFKVQYVSEINQKVLSEKIFNKKRNEFINKNYFSI